MEDELTSLLKYYPQLILISKNPVTWYGFLDIPYKDNATQTLRMKLKLIVPNYPSLKQSEIYFGKKVAWLRGSNFCSKIKNLLETASTVSSFLRQLETLVGSSIDDSICENNSDAVDTLAVGLLEELKNVLQTPSEVEISATHDMDIIKLSMTDVSITLKRDSRNVNPWKIVTSDLPELPSSSSFEKDMRTLTDVINKFKSQVEMFQGAWNCLKMLDENCWVVDPLKPEPHHLYRRIQLSQSLAMLVVIDPLNPTSLPDIKFLGSDKEVEKQIEIVGNNLQKWDPDCDIVENLLELLEICEFPQCTNQDTKRDTDGIVADEECCICYALTMDNEQLPNKICSNEKCRRYFHKYCLLQWLQAVAGNEVVFDTIHGTCPNCGENISCNI